MELVSVLVVFAVGCATGPSQVERRNGRPRPTPSWAGRTWPREFQDAYVEFQKAIE